MFIMSVTREGTSLNFSLDISRSICTRNELCRLALYCIGPSGLSKIVEC